MDEQVKSRKSSTGNLPSKEADLNTVATNVSNAWEQNPDLTLIWTDVGQLKQSVADFGTSYAGRNESKGARMGLTQSLHEINAEVDESAGFVKRRLEEKYKKKGAPAQFASVGIVKECGRYTLPRDNDKRQLALDQMVRGIAQHDLDSRTYNVDYWAGLRDRFVQAKTTADATDQTSSAHVNNKSGHKTIIRKTLKALIHLIQANYPDTWEEELRVWGFQKEKY